MNLTTKTAAVFDHCLGQQLPTLQRVLNLSCPVLLLQHSSTYLVSDRILAKKKITWANKYPLVNMQKAIENGHL
jgi:hypothetical protein